MFSLKSKRAVQFYTEHPELDFDGVNLIFIDLLEKLLKNMSSTLNENLSVDILKELSSKIDSIEKHNEEQSILLKTLNERTNGYLSTLKSNIDESIAKQKETIISGLKDVIKN